ncbi:hypothetical protein PI125_g26190 [Phytophthora idaei]|nr:hypothetical protein PI125_g26190 [Phytophthora idaei]
MHLTFKSRRVQFSDGNHWCWREPRAGAGVGGPTSTAATKGYSHNHSITSQNSGTTATADGGYKPSRSLISILLSMSSLPVS